MEELRNLTDDMTGSYSVLTSSGTAYLFCMDEPRHVIRITAGAEPVAGYAHLGTSALRLDGKQIPLLKVDTLTIGQRGALWLDIRRDGTPTFRDSTPVLAITKLQAPGPESNHP